MALPGNGFLREAAASFPGAKASLVLAPERLAQRHANATVSPKTAPEDDRNQLTLLKTYRYRDNWVRFTEWLRVLRDFRPDVILVLDEPLSINVLLAGIAAKAARVRAPVLFYAFENIVEKIGWKMFGADRNRASLSTLMGRIVCSLMLHHGAMPLRRRLIYGGLVSYCECAEVIRAWGWNPPTAQRWWPINLQVFTRQGPRAAVDLGNRHCIGYTGRFEPEKGLNDLVDAVSKLGDAYGLLLVGDGSERAALERRVITRGIVSRTRFIPPQNHEDLALYYRAMDVFVLPSRTIESWKEQFGRVLIEAKACGVPTVGSDSGAIPFVIGDPERIFPEGDVNALANTLRRVCEEGKYESDNNSGFDEWRPDLFFLAFSALVAENSR
jgi:glycosyltransferase involved in cell wall biosynthesis